MKNKIATIAAIILCNSILTGCIESLKFDSAELTLPPEVFVGSYNFASANGHCELQNWDDGGSEWAKPAEWEWVEVPAGAEPPEIVQVTDNMFAFIPSVAGKYELSVVIECKSYKKSAQATVTKSFSTSEQDIILSSSKTMQKEDGMAMEDQNSLLYNVMKKKYGDIAVSYTDDFNQDGVEETIVRYIQGGKWEMLSFNDNKAGKLFSITTVGDSPIGSVYEILNVGHNEDGSIYIYMYGKEIIKCIFNYNSKTLEKVKTYQVGNLAEYLSQPAVDLNGDGLPEFFGISYNSNGSYEDSLHSYIDTVLTIDPKNEKLIISYDASVNIPASAKFTGFIDEDGDGQKEIVYKIGSEYFVYEY